MTKTADEAYRDATTLVAGVYQHFQHSFGCQIEFLTTLLQKQHYQAAADVMPLIYKEKATFEAALLELQSTLESRANHEKLQAITKEMVDGHGTLPGEAADSGEASAADSGAPA